MDDGRVTTSNNGSAETSGHEQESSNLNTKGSGHRRSLSGSLTAFLFQRSSGQGQGQVQSSSHVDKDSSSKTPTQEDIPKSPRGAMAMAVQQKGTRRRKGSLRKTALLGTGKLRAEGKERRGSQLEQVDSADGAQNESTFAEGVTLMNSPFPYDIPTPRPISSVPPPVPIGTHPVHGDPSKIFAQEKENQTFPSLQRPRTADSTASTTDEEESPASLIAVPPLPKTKPDSYFPPQPPRPLNRHTTASSRSSPLASLPPTVPSPPPSEWDYSETRWWGWIILIVTWIFFVVGMGSCFDVWSWAWDVGEKPEAPPELEDDPTLPVVGYYPALIVLTSVMAWVWVTVAWVGMKYFKHANIPGDE